jgi:DNA-binding MarR family transcriptional regulator
MPSNDAQKVLDHFRVIVKSLREASSASEKSIGISTAQAFVLQKISESPTSLSINELATLTHTHQSSVSVVVNKLVKAKLVERTPSATDARVSEVRLSQAGKKRMGKKILPRIQQKLIDGVNGLTLDERRGLVVGLNALVKQVGLADKTPSLFFEETEKKRRSSKPNGK